MARKRKLVIDELRGAQIRLLGYLTAHDWELLAFLARKLNNLEPLSVDEKFRLLAQPTKRSDEPMAQEAENKPPEQAKAVKDMPLDFQVDFLMATVYKHLHRVAMLLDILRNTYHDLRYEFGDRLDEWLEELDKDVQQGFGFSLLEREESESE